MKYEKRKGELTLLSNLINPRISISKSVSLFLLVRTMELPILLMQAISNTNGMLLAVYKKIYELSFSKTLFHKNTLTKLKKRIIRRTIHFTAKQAVLKF